MIEQVNGKLYEHHYSEFLDCEIWEKLPPGTKIPKFTDTKPLKLNNGGTKPIERVLVVEDEHNVRMAFIEALYKEGYVVYSAETGKRALECIRNQRPDIVILDIKMPDISGLEILKRIRNEDRNLPVIISTAYKGFRQDPEIAIGNVETFMVKPIDLNELTQKVKEILRQKAGGSEE
jgi:DNA-binding response OmpR family regulator